MTDGAAGGIVEKQKALGRGESVVETVAADLQQAFPPTIGFSPRNLRDIKRLYLAYANETIWRQAVAKLPRGVKGAAEIWLQAVAKLTAEAFPDQKIVAAMLRQLGWTQFRNNNWNRNSTRRCAWRGRA